MSTERDRCLAVGEAIQKILREQDVSPDVFNRLATPDGRDALEMFSYLVQMDYAEPMKGSDISSVRNAGVVNLVKGIVTVPDLDAASLEKFVGERRYPYCPTQLQRSVEGSWDYFTGIDGGRISGRGKRFQYLAFKDRIRTHMFSEDVRNHFRKQGYYGHTAAFLVWLTWCGIQTRCATIPEDNACYSVPGGRLLAPYTSSMSCSGRTRFVSYQDISMSWDEDFTFVGFRELPDERAA